MTVDVVFNWGSGNRCPPNLPLRKCKERVIWSNTQQYCNPEVDQILEKAGQENDRNQRIAFIFKGTKVNFKRCTDLFHGYRALSHHI